MKAMTGGSEEQLFIDAMGGCVCFGGMCAPCTIAWDFKLAEAGGRHFGHNVVVDKKTFWSKNIKCIGSVGLGQITIVMTAFIYRG